MSDAPIDLESAQPAEAHKSFWGHLEDLRQALIRSAIAIGLALIVCLLFTDRLVLLLEYPLHHIDLFEKAKPTVSFRIGAQKFGPFAVAPEQFPALPPGDAPHALFDLATVKVGQDSVLALKPAPEDPAEDTSANKVRLHNFGPAEGFFVAFHVALYGALVVSSPFWMYFLGSFIFPALNLRERRALFPWLGWSVTLFMIGVLSTYFVLLPVALRASVMYSNWLGFEGLDWRADDYISFVTRFIVGMGLGFQFPIVVLLLVKIGVLTYEQLAHYRRHVIVVSFILGALLTTPEVITQVAMALPLCILYEICIWIAWYWERKKRRAGENAPP
jgi:sec-independent protein translocase protein TatC